MSTTDETLTEEEIRRLLKVYSDVDEPSPGAVFLGKDGLFFAVDESIFRRIHTDPQNPSKPSPREIASALDAYLELSIDLCSRLSTTEQQLNEAKRRGLALMGESASRQDCTSELNVHHFLDAYDSSSTPANPALRPQLENLRSLCDLLKKIRDALTMYIQITQEQSRRLAKISRYIAHDNTPQLVPVVPLIA